MRHIYMAIIATFFGFNVQAQNIATFDDLTLAPEKFWNGSDQSGSFKSSDIIFYNSYFKGDWESWSGFAYSNTTDKTTPGIDNQYSAISGIGFEGSANYAICYPSPPAELGFDGLTKTTGFYATNSTYAFLSMKNGDAFAKKFGGETGDDPDYFKLMIEALDNDGKPVDTVYFYLADFRFPDNSKDYILNNWTWVDLRELKEARKLRFSLSSSDNSFGYMNTPGYFCMENLNHENLTFTPAAQKTQVLVFPNPFTNQIIISGVKDRARVLISDISGRKVAEYMNMPNNQHINGLQNLNSGVYIITISEGKNQFVTKLLKN